MVRTAPRNGHVPPPPTAPLSDIGAYMDQQQRVAEAERLHALRALGVEPHTCGRQVASLLLGTTLATPMLVSATVGDLRSMELDASAVGKVLTLIGVRISGHDLATLVSKADRARERVARPGENFSVLSVERIEHAAAPSFVLHIKRDDRPSGRFEVEVGWGDLESTWRFQSRLVREIGFMPLLKDGWRGEKFGRFAALLVGSTSVPQVRPEHGKAHGRPEHSQATSDLLVDCLIEYVQAAGGTATCRVTPLYQALTAVAQRRGLLPLDWPRSVPQLCWAFLRIGDGFERAGLEWRKHHQSGKSRVPLYTFRLRVAGS